MQIANDTLCSPFFSQTGKTFDDHYAKGSGGIISIECSIERRWQKKVLEANLYFKNSWLWRGGRGFDCHMWSVHCSWNTSCWWFKLCQIKIEVKIPVISLETLMKWNARRTKRYIFKRQITKGSVWGCNQTLSHANVLRTEITGSQCCFSSFKDNAKLLRNNKIITYESLASHWSINFSAKGYEAEYCWIKRISCISKDRREGLRHFKSFQVFLNLVNASSE